MVSEFSEWSDFTFTVFARSGGTGRWAPRKFGRLRVKFINLLTLTISEFSNMTNGKDEINSRDPENFIFCIYWTRMQDDRIAIIAKSLFVRQIYASLTRKLLSNLFKVTLGQKLRKWSDYAKSKINDMIFTETTRQCKQYTTPPLWELKFLYDYKIQNVRKRLKVSMLNGAMGIFFYHYFWIRMTNSQSVL